ncbi:MAG: hypothetical protein JNM30_09880 [Rhodospirillales bacterium]|nr:hypothetical protein [Rhodospirillales bacterium]
MRNEHEAGWTPGAVSEANEELLSRVLKSTEDTFAEDKFHASLAFVIRAGEVLRVLHIYGEDSAAVQVQMVRLAMQIEQDKADALILVGECWSAPVDELGRYERPSESDSRVELLYVDLIQANGAVIHCYTSIERNGDDAWLGEWSMSSDFRNFSLTPVYMGWGHPVPEEWRTMTLNLVMEAKSQRQ